MKEHGRLLSIKKNLVSMLDENDNLDPQTLGLFQLKDFGPDEDQLQNEIKLTV